MALFSYFQRVHSILPKPDGPLSTAVPVSTITAANKEVEKVLELSSTTEVKKPMLTSKDRCLPNLLVDMVTLIMDSNA